jgi:hypothetical protein
MRACSYANVKYRCHERKFPCTMLEVGGREWVVVTYSAVNRKCVLDVDGDEVIVS